MNLRWYILKHKVGKFIGLSWCDWCDMVCYKPTKTKDETICRHCMDGANLCECCEMPVNFNDSREVPWGQYCQDCYEDIYG